MPDHVNVNLGAILRRSRPCTGRRLRDERGVTIIEMAVSMAVLGIVVGAVGTLLSSGTRAEASLNMRFRSQTEARIALDAMRREVHTACSATVTGGTTLALRTFDAQLRCTVPSSTWCITGTGTRRRLFRQAGATCSAASGQQRADFLLSTSQFTIVAGAAGSGLLPRVGIDFRVNPEPTNWRYTYRLQDELALRNARRS